MKIQLVADSSANICANVKMPITYVPMKIVAGGHEYVDTPELDCPHMMQELKQYKGSSGTACPSVQEWIDAFDNSDIVFGTSITHQLSGCYNAATIAVTEYLEQKPDAKVFILDSLSTGPGMELIMEKYEELIGQGREFEEICAEVKEYSRHLGLLFTLGSVENLVKNGRVSPLVGKAVGMLNLRIIGRASKEGELEPLHKCRGEKKALQQLVADMKTMGYHGGKVRISHTYNLGAVNRISELVREEYPDADITSTCNRGLCCHYAEEGGVIVGFETV